MIPEIELEINTRETTGNSPNPRKPRPSRRPQARLFSEERQETRAETDRHGRGRRGSCGVTPESRGVTSVIQAPGRQKEEHDAGERGSRALKTGAGDTGPGLSRGAPGPHCGQRGAPAPRSAGRASGTLLQGAPHPVSRAVACDPFLSVFCRVHSSLVSCLNAGSRAEQTLGPGPSPTPRERPERGSFRCPSDRPANLHPPAQRFRHAGFKHRESLTAGQLPEHAIIYIPTYPLSGKAATGTIRTCKQMLCSRLVPPRGAAAQCRPRPRAACRAASGPRWARPGESTSPRQAAATAAAPAPAPTPRGEPGPSSWWKVLEWTV